MSNNESVSRHVRKYLFEKYNNACEKCGWNIPHPKNNKVPLEIHHKDGNYKNSRLDNIELLCPNCHSLTPNHGSRNNGNGRKSRKML